MGLVKNSAIYVNVVLANMISLSPTGRDKKLLKNRDAFFPVININNSLLSQMRIDGTRFTNRLLFHLECCLFSN